eukprot:781723-Rhodomonas_salina.1
MPGTDTASAVIQTLNAFTRRNASLGCDLSAAGMRCPVLRSGVGLAGLHSVGMAMNARYGSRRARSAMSGTEIAFVPASGHGQSSPATNTPDLRRLNSNPVRPPPPLSP